MKKLLSTLLLSFFIFSFSTFLFPAMETQVIGAPSSGNFSGSGSSSESSGGKVGSGSFSQSNNNTKPFETMFDYTSDEDDDSEIIFLVYALIDIVRFIMYTFGTSTAMKVLGIGLLLILIYALYKKRKKFFKNRNSHSNHNNTNESNKY